MQLLWLVVAMVPILTACDNEAARVPARWTDSAAPANAPIPPKWFRDDQVKLGESLYRTHCAECHGQKAEGAVQWRKIGPDGRFPPPPLNGTGHAWHHSLDVLSQVIMEGVPGGEKSMPAWEGRLSREEVEAIIAWFQSLWPNEIYVAWNENSR